MTSENVSIRSVPHAPPDLLPGLGSMAFARDPLGFLQRGVRDYGPAFTTRVGPMKLCVLGGADALQQVLQEQSKHFRKSAQYEVLKLFLGDGLVASDGELWVQQRRVVKPVFRRHVIEGFAEAMVAQTEAMLKRWEGTQRIDTFAEMVRLALDIVGATVISTDADLQSSSLGRAITYAVEHVGRMQGNPFHPPIWLPTPANLRFRRAMRAVSRTLLRLIRERRASAERPHDLLTQLLEARDEETGQTMSDAEVYDQIVTFFIAAHETTASTLTFLWQSLATHPEIENALCEEVERTLAGRTPTLADLSELRFTRRVIEETLRKYPPAWVIGRTPKCDVEISGLRIPKGLDVLIPVHAVHHDPAHWQRPNDFYPDHFLDDAKASRHPYAYIPFGAGPRVCIGNHFAMMELLIVVALVVRRYRMSLVTKKPLKLKAAAVLRIEGSQLPMMLTPRR